MASPAYQIRLARVRVMAGCALFALLISGMTGNMEGVVPLGFALAGSWIGAILAD